ncbi:MAG: hypothetical protein IPK27_06370 [Rhodanobacteraceae bacterium]|nr:hypothetical protein [Rhodanobacteraceae bacterium]
MSAPSTGASGGNRPPFSGAWEWTPQWTDLVRAVEPEQGFCRVIGSKGALVDKAAEIGQRWLRGLSVARSLAN